MGFSTNIFKDMGAKKDPKAGAKGAPTKNPKKKEGGGGGKAKKKKWSKGKTRDKLNNLVLFDKERRRRWWQGQKEEVVQGKDKGQVEQFGPLRQAYLRETFEGSPNIQTDHPLNCERKIKGSRIPGKKSSY